MRSRTFAAALVLLSITVPAFTDEIDIPLGDASFRGVGYEAACYVRPEEGMCRAISESSPMPVAIIGGGGGGEYTGPAANQLPDALGANGGLKIEGVENGVEVTVSLDDGADAALGAKADAAAATPSTTATLIATMRGLWTDYLTHADALIAQTPRVCTGPIKSHITSVASSSTDASLGVSECTSGTCQMYVVENVGSNAAMVQFNGSSGADGVCLAGATAHPELLWAIDTKSMPAITSAHATNTDPTTCPSAYGSVGATSFKVTLCD